LVFSRSINPIDWVFLLRARGRPAYKKNAERYQKNADPALRRNCLS
jgi:hypothetical protein